HARCDGPARRAGGARRGGARVHPARRLRRGGGPAAPGAAHPQPWRRALRRAPLAPVTKKLILVVIDGLTPDVFEDAVSSGRAPTLSFLAANGEYRRAVSTFPSLTPVCLSSIATGAHPSAHGIPHLVWYDRERERIVEYGSSFAPIPAGGPGGGAPGPGTPRNRA